MNERMWRWKKKVATSFADLDYEHYEHFRGFVNAPVCEIQYIPVGDRGGLAWELVDKSSSSTILTKMEKGASCCDKWRYIWKTRILIDVFSVLKEVKDTPLKGRQWRTEQRKRKKKRNMWMNDIEIIYVYAYIH